MINESHATPCEEYGHAFERCQCDMQHQCPMLICRDCDEEHEDEGM